MSDLARVTVDSPEDVVRSVEIRMAGNGDPVGSSVVADLQTMRLNLEAEREDVDIDSAVPQGIGSDDTKWPYGGNIAYSFNVELAKTAASRVKLLPTAPPSPTNIYRSPRKQRAVGPFDTPDNPLGPIATRNASSEMNFTVTIQKPRFAGKSFRLARRFGSRRIVTFKIHRKVRAEHNVVDLFSGRVLLVMGRTYRAFWVTPEGDNVFAIETGDELPDGLMRVGRSMQSFEDTMSRKS